MAECRLCRGITACLPMPPCHGINFFYATIPLVSHIPSLPSHGYPIRDKQTLWIILCMLLYFLSFSLSVLDMPAYFENWDNSINTGWQEHNTWITELLVKGCQEKGTFSNKCWLYRRISSTCDEDEEQEELEEEVEASSEAEQGENKAKKLILDEEPEEEAAESIADWIEEGFSTSISVQISNQLRNDSPVSRNSLELCYGTMPWHKGLCHHSTA